MGPELSSMPLRGERLRDLAEMQGLSMSALADRLGVSQTTVSKTANGVREMPAELAGRAAEVFDVPVTFFMVAPASQDAAAVTFRKRASSGARADRRITRLFREAARLWRTVSAASGLGAADLPSPEGRGVEQVAAALRARDGLGPGDPVPNVVRFIERCGIGVVTGLDVPDGPAGASGGGAGDDHSGISCPSRFEDRPLVATVGSQPGAVARMTLAHELGHQVFDADLAVSPRSREEVEQRAFAFAGALLLPAGVVRRRVSEDMTLSAYLRVKADYGVSVGAIVVRARRLGVISTGRARSLHIQLSSRGWRSDEPVLVPVEEPLLVGQAVRRVWPVNTAAAAAQAVGVRQSLVNTWAGLGDAIAPEAGSGVLSLTERLRSRR